MHLGAKLAAASALAALLSCTCIGCGGGGGESSTTTTTAAFGVQGVVLAGSGGCDGQDTVGNQTCKNNKTYDEGTKIVHAYNLQPSADLSANWVSTTIKEVGVPAWMVYGTTPDPSAQQCVWVILADNSTIVTYQYNSGTGLKQSSTVDAHGVNPVHGSVSSDGKTLVVANYHGPDDGCNSTGAGVASFSILDCDLTFVTSIAHSGSSVNKDRQCSAHVHSCTAGRDDFVFCCDLGMDAIFTYKAAANSSIAQVAILNVTAGQGPRHSAIHPTKPVLYTLTEMGSQVLVIKIGEDGALDIASNISTLPVDHQGTYGSKAAEVVISPDGKFLYATNRAFKEGWDSTVAVFNISADGLTLNNLQQKVVPRYPRGMAITTLKDYINDEGKHMANVNVLLVESQTYGTISSFPIAADGKMLNLTGTAVGPPGASSIVVLPCTGGESC